MIGQRSGVGRYAAEILKRLPAALPSFVELGFHTILVSKFPPVPLDEVASEARRPSLLAALKRAPLLRPAARAVSALLARFAIDGELYWAPNHSLPRGVSFPRNVVTVHDLSWLLHPDWHPADRVAIFGRDVPRSLARADRVICDSQAIRADLIERLRVPPERVSVVHLGADPQRFRIRSATEIAPVLQRFSLGARPFLLSVGTLEPRKNLATLLAAWARLGKAERREHELLIAGGEGWRDGPLRAALQAAGPSVRVLGRVSEEELACLYARATALVYPSVYEGFGLPPLEALACGTLPVVADLPVLHEVLGAAAVFYGAPLDTAALEAALVPLLSGGPADASTREQRRSARAGFTWEKSARAHAALFAQLL